jgi:single-stranded DNA-binding protein
MEVIGNLGKDPEMLTVKNGDMVKSSLAEYFSKEHSNWYNLVAFGHAAKQLMEAKKGDKVKVYGYQKFYSYTAKDGSEKKTLDFFVDCCKIIKRKDDTPPAQASDPFPESPADTGVPF